MAPRNVILKFGPGDILHGSVYHYFYHILEDLIMEYQLDCPEYTSPIVKDLYYNRFFPEDFPPYGVYVTTYNKTTFEPVETRTILVSNYPLMIRDAEQGIMHNIFRDPARGAHTHMYRFIYNNSLVEAPCMYMFNLTKVIEYQEKFLSKVNHIFIEPATIS
jgi:hypothetical protein